MERATLTCACTRSGVGHGGYRPLGVPPFVVEGSNYLSGRRYRSHSHPKRNLQAARTERSSPKGPWRRGRYLLLNSAYDPVFDQQPVGILEFATVDKAVPEVP